MRKLWSELTFLVRSLYQGGLYPPSSSYAYTASVSWTTSGTSFASSANRCQVIVSLRFSSGVEAYDAQLAPWGQ